MTSGFDMGTVFAVAMIPNAPAARRRRLSREVRESLPRHAALDQFETWKVRRRNWPAFRRERFR